MITPSVACHGDSDEVPSSNPGSWRSCTGTRFETVMVTGADVHDLPAAFTAVETSVCGPFDSPVVSQSNASEGPETVVRSAPSMETESWPIPPGSDASAVTGTELATVVPSDGVVTAVAGGSVPPPPGTRAESETSSIRNAVVSASSVVARNTSWTVWPANADRSNGPRSAYPAAASLFVRVATVSSTTPAEVRTCTCSTSSDPASAVSWVSISDQKLREELVASWGMDTGWLTESMASFRSPSRA